MALAGEVNFELGSGIRFRDRSRHRGGVEVVPSVRGTFNLAVGFSS